MRNLQKVTTKERRLVIRRSDSDEAFRLAFVVFMAVMLTDFFLFFFLSAKVLSKKESRPHKCIAVIKMACVDVKVAEV